MLDLNNYSLVLLEKDLNLDLVAKATAKKKRQGRTTLDLIDIALLI